jgi:CheY-like chemotaxis protein
MESIGRLAGGVAHDFNNLLTVINGYSQMLIETMPAADPMRSTLEEIRKAGDRAAGLTRQLLAFGRKQVLKPRRIDLNEVVRGMTSLLQRLTGAGVRLSMELAPEAVLVNADPHQVEQVIMNLTINARHATADGGAVRIITQDGVSGPGGKRYGVLSVTDSGAGMDAETRKHIFEPFFTTKGPAKGTGLGLPVVQGIVDQSGGWIEVISAPGEGSTFRVCLPSAEAGSVEKKAPAQAQPTYGGETILLVEDQSDVRAYAAAALEFHGYHVLRADGARQALKLWSDHSPRIDLVVTDVVMPEVSGPELAGRLRALQPGVRILFMSGYADTQLARLGLEQAGGALLEKPFTPSELASRVRAMLGR